MRYSTPHFHFKNFPLQLFFFIYWADIQKKIAVHLFCMSQKCCSSSHIPPQWDFLRKKKNAKTKWILFLDVIAIVIFPCSPATVMSQTIHRQLGNNRYIYTVEQQLVFLFSR
jgi:hypothetical protein